VTARFAGALVTWRGTFGFLRPDGGGRADDMFLNLSALVAAGVDDAVVGDRFTWSVGEGPDGRVRATDVRPEHAPRAPRPVREPVRP